MKLETLEQMAKSQCKRRSACFNNGYPVKITKVRYGKNEKYAYRVAMDVYEEPCNCNFKKTTFWLPVYVPNLKRLYLVYSDKNTGYKNVAPNSKKKIGRIEFQNKALMTTLDSLFIGGNKDLFFNWKWDTDCSRAYIEII